MKKSSLSLFTLFLLFTIQNVFSKGCDIYTYVNSETLSGLNVDYSTTLSPGSTLPVSRSSMGCGCTFVEARWYRNGILMDTNCNYIIADTGYYVGVVRVISCNNSAVATANIDVHSPESLFNPYSISSSSHSFCQGDTAVLTLPRALSYTWVNGLGNQSVSITLEGVYYATVNDTNGVQHRTPDFYVHFSHSPTFSFVSSADTVCYNSFFKPIITEDQLYFYKWTINGSGSQNNTTYIKPISSGWYKITINSICGSDSDSTFLAVSTRPQISASQNVFCPGDSALLYVTTRQINFQWIKNGVSIPGANDNHYTVKNAGGYSMLATDSIGCTIESNEVNIFTYNTTQLLSDDLILCDQDTILLTTSSPYAHYQWQNGDTLRYITVTTPGTYYLSVIDFNNCSISDTIDITSNIYSPLDLIQDTILCTNTILTLSAPAGYTGYNWSNGMNSQIISVNSSMADSSYYSLIATDQNGCNSSDSILVVYEVCTSVSTVDNFPVEYYINGNIGKIKIQATNSSAKRTIQIFDATGKLVYDALEGNINMPNINGGIYLWQVRENNRIVQTGKMRLN
jgi:hypothetical protein